MSRSGHLWNDVCTIVWMHRAIGEFGPIEARR